jgi:hypothetical protein
MVASKQRTMKFEQVAKHFPQNVAPLSASYPRRRRNPVCRGECEDLALRLQSARRPGGNPDPGSRARVSDLALAAIITQDEIILL